MSFAWRLVLGLVGGSAASLVCAAAVLRRLPAEPDDAMSAAGMTLMLVWPVLIASAFVPARTRLGAAVIAGAALVAWLAGWVVG